MAPDNRRSFVKKSLATSVSISFTGLLRAHGEEGGGSPPTNTTFDPNQSTFPGTTPWDSNQSTIPAETVTGDPNQSTVPAETVTWVMSTVSPQWYIRCKTAPSLVQTAGLDNYKRSSSGKLQEIKLAAWLVGPKVGDKAPIASGLTIHVQITADVADETCNMTPTDTSYCAADFLNLKQVVKGDPVTHAVVFVAPNPSVVGHTTHPGLDADNGTTNRNFVVCGQIDSGELTSVWANWSAHASYDSLTLDLLPSLPSIPTQKWEFEVIYE